MSSSNNDNKNNNNLTCSTCNRIFGSVGGLKQHQRNTKHVGSSSGNNNNDNNSNINENTGIGDNNNNTNNNNVLLPAPRNKIINNSNNNNNNNSDEQTVNNSGPFISSTHSTGFLTTKFTTSSSSSAAAAAAASSSGSESNKNFQEGGSRGRGRGRGESGRGRGRGRGRGDGKCFTCGGDHLARDCPNNTNTDNNNNNIGRGSGGGGPQQQQVSKQSKNYYDKIIHQFVHSDETEMEFPSTLTPAQRLAVHKLASQFNLNHKSYGEGENRKLKISKPNVSSSSSDNKNNNNNNNKNSSSSESQPQKAQKDFYSDLQPLNDRVLQSTTKLEEISKLVEPQVEKMNQLLKKFAKDEHYRQKMMGGEETGTTTSITNNHHHHYNHNQHHHGPRSQGLIHHSRRPAHPSSTSSSSSSSKNKKYQQQNHDDVLPPCEMRKKLPTYQAASSIIDAVKRHDIVLITASTGSGKTTQVPNLLLESGILQENSLVLCTQPRRISAISVSQRVAAEREESVGNTVGYTIRFESETSSATRLVYMTTGILLRRLHSDPQLQDVSCVVVDEVHERDIQTDQLLCILKELIYLQQQYKEGSVHSSSSASASASETNNMNNKIYQRRYPLKVVVMSATMQTERLLDYLGSFKVETKQQHHFSGEEKMKLMKPHHISIKGTLFPVRSFFLEDVYSQLELGEVGEKEFAPFIPAVVASKARNEILGVTTTAAAASSSTTKTSSPSAAFSSPTTSSSNAFDAFSEKAAILSAERELETLVPYSTIVQLIKHIHLSNRNNDDMKGAILVFLPGWSAIDKIMKLLRDEIITKSDEYKYSSSSNYHKKQQQQQQQNQTNNNLPLSRQLSILPLHSSLSSGEQRLVFDRPPKFFRKVVLATNIAETSITVEDVCFVIDSCLHKSTNYENTSNTTGLQCQLVSRANCTQRKGRAGRVRAGDCYHLIPKQIYDQLPEYLAPEMLRSNLLDVCLQSKAVMPSKKISDFLSTAMDPPPSRAINHAVEHLEQIGALNNQEVLTGLGKALASMPTDVVLGKMLLLGACFGVLDAICVISAALGAKSPFIRPPPHLAKAALVEKQRLAGNSGSDHFAILSLYRKWRVADRPAYFAAESYADHGVLLNIERTVRQLKQSVIDSGFVAIGDEHEEQQVEQEGEGEGRRNPKNRRSSSRRNNTSNKKNNNNNNNNQHHQHRNRVKSIQELDRIASKNRDNSSLIQLCLAMALFPSMASRERQLRKVNNNNNINTNKVLQEKVGRESWICFDGKQSQISPGSALASLSHADFYQREFSVYFERMRIETQVVLFDATALPRSLMMLGVKRLTKLDKQETYALISSSPINAECRYAPIEKLSFSPSSPPPSSQKNNDNDNDNSTSTSSAAAATSQQQQQVEDEECCLIVEDGIKRFALSEKAQDLIYKLHCCLHFFFAFSTQQMKLSEFPFEVVNACSVVGGTPVQEHFQQKQQTQESDLKSSNSNNNNDRQKKQTLLISYEKEETEGGGGGAHSDSDDSSSSSSSSSDDDDDGNDEEEDTAPRFVTASSFAASIGLKSPEETKTSIEVLSSLFGDLTVFSSSSSSNDNNNNNNNFNTVSNAALRLLPLKKEQEEEIQNTNGKQEQQPQIISGKNNNDDEDEIIVQNNTGAGFF